MGLHNIAAMTTATSGTGTITLGSAVSGYNTFANAGVVDGETVTYSIKDGTAREVGTGVYTASGTTLTRATVLSSTSGGSKISLSGSAEVYLTAAAEDVTTNILERVLDYIGLNNSDPIDTIIRSGNSVALIFFKGAAGGTYENATNAKFTVATGKKAVLVHYSTEVITRGDFSSRKWRMWNNTDSADLLSSANFYYETGLVFAGDGGTASKVVEVPAAKEIILQCWSADATKRACGGYAIFKEVTA